MWDDPGETLCAEAADEIERLRANADTRTDAILAAGREIRRLRTALEEIADMPPIQTRSGDGPILTFDAEQKIARAALDEQTAP